MKRIIFIILLIIISVMLFPDSGTTPGFWYDDIQEGDIWIIDEDDISVNMPKDSLFADSTYFSGEVFFDNVVEMDSTVIVNDSMYVNEAVFILLQLADTDTSNVMDIKWDEDDSADRTLNFKVNGADRTLDFSEDFTVGSGNAGTLVYSAASKTLTVEDDVTVGLDVNALEALASNGILVRTASNTYNLRTITATSNETSVSNGDGVSGNPVIGLADDVVIPSSLESPIYNYTDATLLEIATGAITVTQSAHIVGGESDADDNLVTINGLGSEGNELILYPQSDSETITIATSGNIVTPNGYSYEIPYRQGLILTYHDSKWYADTGSSTNKTVDADGDTWTDVELTSDDDYVRMNAPNGYIFYKNIDDLVTLYFENYTGTDFDKAIGSNSSDELVFYKTLNVGPIEFEANSGEVSAFNIPVTDTGSDTHGLWLQVDSNAIFGITADEDGSGGVDTWRMKYKGDTDTDLVMLWDGTDNDGTITYMEDEDSFDVDNDFNIGGDLTVATDFTMTDGDAHLTTTNGKTLITDYSTTEHVLNVRANSGKTCMITFTEDTVGDRWVIASETTSSNLKFATGSSASYVDRFSLKSTGIDFVDQGNDTNSLKLSLVANDGGTTQTSDIYTAYGTNPYLVLAPPNAAGTPTSTLNIRTDLLSFIDGYILSTQTTDDDNVLLQAVDNDTNTLSTVAELHGAAVPTFDLTAGRLTGNLNTNSNYISGDGDSEGISIDASGNVTVSGTITVGEFTQYKTIYASAAQVGGTAPTATTVETFRGLLFNAVTELCFIEFEVPNDWNGTSDMEIKIYGFAESGDAVADGEVIEFDAQYRSLENGEAYDNGTAVTITPNYTQSGAGTDKALIELEATIDYDHTDQPLAKGDVVGFKINRDVTTDDTYSGDFNVIKFEIVYTANTFPIHQ